MPRWPMNSNDWTYGTLLKRRNGETVMFVRWDKKRDYGGGWFVGIRLVEHEVRYGELKVAASGDQGNYMAAQFRLLEPEEAKA